MLGEPEPVDGPESLDPARFGVTVLADGRCGVLLPGIEGIATVHEQLAIACEKAGIAPESLNVVMELGSPEALKGLVATGLGFTILSTATIAKETRLGQLVRIPLSPRLIRKLSVVYPKERFRSRLIDSFVQFAKSRLAKAG